MLKCDDKNLNRNACRQLVKQTHMHRMLQQPVEYEKNKKRKK